MAKIDPHTGGRFDDFLKEEGIYDEVQVRALKRALAGQIGEGMQPASLTKTAMASKMSTSRSHCGQGGGNQDQQNAARCKRVKSIQ